MVFPSPGPSAAGSGINGRARSGRRGAGEEVLAFEGVWWAGTGEGGGAIYGEVRLGVVRLRSAQPGSTVERRPTGGAVVARSRLPNAGNEHAGFAALRIL